MNNKPFIPLIFLSVSMLFIMVSGTALAHIVVKLFGVWSITCSSLIFPFSFMVNVIIAELYKRKISFTVFLTCITFSLLFGFIASHSITLAIPFVLWGTLGSIASLSVNTLLVTKQKLWLIKSFTLRYLFSTTVGELILVTIVTFGVFYISGNYTIAKVIQIWSFSYVSKIVITLIAAFPTKILAHFFKVRYEL